MRGWLKTFAQYCSLSQTLHLSWDLYQVPVYAACINSSRLPCIMNITAVCNLHSPRCLPSWWWSYCCRGSPFLEHDMIRWYTCNKGQLQIFSEVLKKITCLAQCAYKCKQKSFAFRYHKLNLKTEPFNSTQRWKIEKVQKHNKIKKKTKQWSCLGI